MSLPLYPTLTEMVESVRIRSGAIGASLSGDQVSFIKEALRQSQAELYFEAEWVRLHLQVQITLTEGLTDYDLPDGIEVGNLHRLMVYAPTGVPGQGQYIEVDNDDGTWVYNAYKTNSRPKVYTIWDGGVIRLKPAPDATWTTLVIDYDSAQNPLVNNADRPSVDPEALIQRATIKVKKMFGIGDPSADEVQHEKYLQHVRHNQGPNESFRMASDAITGPDYWKYTNRAIGRTSWTTDWNPWP